MTIDIVHPAHYDENGALVQATKLVDRLGAYLPHLGPALLAALTPAHHRVRMVDEYVQDIDLDTDADVIGISAQIMQYQRCLDLAAAYHQRGKKVILGGYLPTLMPDSVESFFDSVVVGEGDDVWPQALEDLERGRLRPRYVPDRPVDLDRLPVPRYDLIPRDRLVVFPVQATRGCPFTCTYCSITAAFGATYRTRRVDHILRDIAATKSRWINFCDDNLCEDVRFVDELFTAMDGMKIRWGTQTTINVALHPELLRKAKRSGCELLALGVESLSLRNLQDVQKTFYALDRYAEGFRRIMDAGISPHALMIFGLPEDDGSTFRKTVDYLEKLDIPVAQFFILTPYPGTPNGDRMRKEGSIVDQDPSHLREPYVVFRPERLTAKELRDGWWEAVRSFYSVSSILRRVVFGRAPNRVVNLVTNMYYWSKVKRGIHPVYFG